MTDQERGEAAARRAADIAGKPEARQLRRQPPSGPARLQPFKGEFRAAKVEHQGKERHQLDGVASVTDQPYEMWDLFGPYTEVVEGGAFDETLAADPDVAFLVNHRGVTMARTTSGTLELEATGLGLQARAYVNPERQDVRDLIVAIDDRDITEMSFAFIIEEGEWNDDFTEFRISKVNLDRGDVSAVNYGANPYTSIGARAQEVLRDVRHLPAGAARAAMAELRAREDLATEPPGRSVGLELALLRAELD